MKSINTASILTVAAALLFSVTLLVGGQAQAELDGAALFASKTCNACHGADAKTPLMPIYPKLAGQNAEYALQQMKDIKSGARNNGQTAAMKGVMHLVTDEEMAAIAQYVSTLAP